MNQPAPAIDSQGPVIDRVLPPRWLVYRLDDSPDCRVVEVQDMMRCINGPGDFGWVDSTDNTWLGPMGVIAHFEQLFPTREAAVKSHAEKLRAKIVKLAAELERWERENKEAQGPLRSPGA